MELLISRNVSFLPFGVLILMDFVFGLMQMSI